MPPQAPGQDPDAALRCAECGRKPRPGENPADEWRGVRNRREELQMFCPDCFRRDFGTTHGVKRQPWTE
jgi:hypothetical protein